jgi:hypothetical protein
MYPPPARPTGALESSAGARTVPTDSPAHSLDVPFRSLAPNPIAVSPDLCWLEAMHGETPVRGLRWFGRGQPAGRRLLGRGLERGHHSYPQRLRVMARAFSRSETDEVEGVGAVGGHVPGGLGDVVPAGESQEADR